MKAIHGKHFSIAETGSLRDLGQHSHPHPKLGPIRGKLFLRELLGLTSMEVSLGKMGPGAALPFFHKHREHEELYIIVGGRGQFQIDDQIFDVKEGSVIRVAPEGARTWRNNSTEDLFYICVQAAAGTVQGNVTSDGVGVDRPVQWR
jgi:mannose-6-phosphate isomerase-like protein (cupin superfamily)